MFSWFKFFKKEKEKEEWRLVKTITEQVDGVSRGTTYSGIVFYHLSESSLGNRKVVVASTMPSIFNDKLDSSARRLEIYQSKIYRWEQGRSDPDIPRFAQIPEDELVHALKGSIE